MGRFINADALVSTGQGILGNNMFAYCRNNPVCRRDISGHEDEKIDDGTVEVSPDEDELGFGSGGGSWEAFTSTMKAAAFGLTMAGGDKDASQIHHYFSPKNKKYAPQFQMILDDYGLDMNDPWNQERIDGHKGRHTNDYHEFMLKMAEEIDKIAEGNVDMFLEGFAILTDFIQSNSWIPYGKSK